MTKKQQKPEEPEEKPKLPAVIDIPGLVNGIVEYSEIRNPGGVGIRLDGSATVRGTRIEAEVPFEFGDDTTVDVEDIEASRPQPPRRRRSWTGWSPPDGAGDEGTTDRN